MTCSLGGPEEQGADMVKMLKIYVDGTNEDHYYSPNIAIDASNVAEYIKSVWKVTFFTLLEPCRPASPTASRHNPGQHTILR